MLLVHFYSVSQAEYPANLFTILELQNPPFDFPELHKIRRSPDLAKGTQRVDCNFQRGYLSYMEPVMHFGYSNGTRLDSLTVAWPNGTQQIIHDLKNKKELNISFDKSQKSKAPDLKQKVLFADGSQFLVRTGINHREDIYDDFKKEVLLPQKFSTMGPALAVADVNGDGSDDIYLGGSMDHKPGMYVMKGPQVIETSSSILSYDADFEDLGAIFFNANGDNLPDLYVCSGGGGEIKNTKLLQDRLYINEGNGQFGKAPLPKITSSTKAVIAFDKDGDGDEDLFVGGRNVPGKYPDKAPSYLLENNGGKFKNVINSKFQAALPNMVTDAETADVDADGDIDLIIAGEWSTPKIFLNDGKGNYSEKVYADLANISGWWYSISKGDFNNDGKPDFVFGNLGENNKFHVSVAKPLKLLYDDFDTNGTQDIVLAKKYNGKTVPVRGKECSTEQMPFLEAKFPTFHDFASSSIEEILGEKVESCNSLMANYFSSAIILSTTSGYTVKALPFPAQWGPIMDSVVLDVNGDGQQDIITVGRIENAEPETPSYDASRGLILYGKGNGEFEPDFSIAKTGLNLNRNSKQIEIMRRGNQYGIIIANNNSSPQLYLKT